MTEWFLPAYIDPGSGLQFFSFLGPLLAALAGAIGLLLWPFRKMWGLFISGRKIGWLLVMALAVVVGGGLFLLLRPKAAVTKAAPGLRVLVVGIDGMDPVITQGLMAEGKLPNFKRLAETGTFKTIQTTNPAQSPVAWSTIATGANPGEHGLFDFIWRHEESYLPDLSLAVLEPPEKRIKLFGQELALGRSRYRSERGGIPVWSLTSEAKIPTVVVRWPVTFPPEPVEGKMLSGMGVPDIRGGQGTFSFYTSEKTDDARPQGGMVISVAEGKEIRSELFGPRGPRGSDLTTPLEIDVDRETRSVSLRVNGSRFRLQEGSWSGWIRVKFPVDFFTQVKAMCRFYLKSVANPFELYVSPMNLDPRDPAFPISYENDYARRLQEAIGDFHTLGMPHDTWALNEGRMNEEMFLSQTDTIVAEERAMVLHELKRFESGLFMVVFETLDRVQHMFWRYRDPKSPLYNEEDGKKYEGVIARTYEQMDSILGEILEFVDERTVLIANSDHGFTNFRRTVHLNSWLRSQGYLTLKEGAEEGRALFREVDWSRTKAYAVGLGSLYVNLRGRESQGIVVPGEEKERLEKELIENLERVVDQENGEKMVHKVYRREEIFSGSRFDQMSDLVVAFRPGYRASWQTALGATPRALVEDNLKKWSGDHIVEPSFVPGVFFSNRKVAPEREISLYDIAPSVVSLFGITPPKGYLGQPIFETAAETSALAASPR